MGIVESEFKKLWALNTTAEAVCWNVFNEITGITLQVRGILGGKGMDGPRVTWYRVFIDVENIRSESIPDVYILEPPDGDIEHVNIYHSASNYCKKLGKELPRVCWGDYTVEWKRTKRHNRTLVSLVRRLEMVLSDQNFESPAR